MESTVDKFENESAEETNQSDDDEEYNSDNEDFYFESDHLPLRGNADYRAVLRSIVILEAQRIEIIKHIETIVQVQKKALHDPENFLKKLTSGENLELPRRVNIHNVNIRYYLQDYDEVMMLFFQFRYPKSNGKSTTYQIKWTNQAKMRSIIMFKTTILQFVEG